MSNLCRTCNWVNKNISCIEWNYILVKLPRIVGQHPCAISIPPHLAFRRAVVTQWCCVTGQAGPWLFVSIQINHPLFWTDNVINTRKRSQGVLKPGLMRWARRSAQSTEHPSLTARQQKSFYRGKTKWQRFWTTFVQILLWQDVCQKYCDALSHWLIFHWVVQTCRCPACDILSIL